MSNTIHILDSDGRVIEVEREPGVQYTSVPQRYLPLAFHEADAPMVYYPCDTVTIMGNKLPTRDDARRQLRGAGMHPEPQMIDSYVRERKMTEKDKKRHERKVSEMVRKATNLDGKAKKEVEG